MARVKYYGTAFSKDGAGVMSVMDAADVNVYEGGTMTPVPIYAGAVGGSPIGSLLTDVAGYYQFWTDRKDTLRIQITKTLFDTILRDEVLVGHGIDAYLNDHDDVNLPSPADGQSLIFNIGTGKWEATDLPAAGVATFDVVVDMQAAGDKETQFATALQNPAVNSIAVIGNYGDFLDYDGAGWGNQIYIGNDCRSKYIWFEPGVYVKINLASDPPIPPSDNMGWLNFNPSVNISDYDWMFVNMFTDLTAGDTLAGLFSFGDFMGSTRDWLRSLRFENCYFRALTGMMFLEVLPVGNYLEHLAFDNCWFLEYSDLKIDDQADDGKGARHVQSVNTQFISCSDTGVTDWWKKFNRAYEIAGGILRPKPWTGLNAGKFSYLDADSVDGFNPHLEGYTGSIPAGFTSIQVQDGFITGYS